MTSKNLLIIFLLINLQQDTWTLPPQNESIETLEYFKEDILTKTTIYELLKTNEGCQIYYFEFVRMSNSKDPEVVMYVNRGAKLNQRVRDALKKSQSGDFFFIEHIDSMTDCLQFQRNGSDVYKIEIK